MSFSMLYFSIACVAQSTASCCMSSDMSAFLITAFRSDIVTLHGGESVRGPGVAGGCGRGARARGRDAGKGGVSLSLSLAAPAGSGRAVEAAPDSRTC